MQQVNLYQPILRKQEKVFSAKTLLQGNLLVLVALTLIYLFTLFQSQGLQQQLNQNSQRRDEQVKRLAELTAQFPPRSKDASLPARIEQARTTLQQKHTILTAVRDLGLDSEVHFSEHLTALARRDLPDLWLQRIFLQYGQQVELQGSAYRAEEVPLYLQRLSEEPPFQGTAFQSVVIARSEEFDNQVNFALSTRLTVKEARR